MTTPPVEVLTREEIVEVTASPDPPLRMNAYYYGFDETGMPPVDRILSAVARAGKGYHHTESWTEVTEWSEGGLSYADLIQRAADEAATTIRRLLATLAERDRTIEEQHHEIGQLVRSVHAVKDADIRALKSTITDLQRRLDEATWREHKPATNEMHDPANGLIAGYCRRCVTPWPCQYSPESAQPTTTETEGDQSR